MSNAVPLRQMWFKYMKTAVKALRSPKPYEGMNITGVTGLTAAQVMTLKALGAVENTEQK
ncbi:MAG: hypothetical protein RMY29_024635 [Nostoc sp. CreGUA01]|nr:hypothetical protein [Nostoc sp. CreGUA01]